MHFLDTENSSSYVPEDARIKKKSTQETGKESWAKKEVDFRGSPSTNQKKVTHPVASLHILPLKTPPPKTIQKLGVSEHEPLFSLFGPAINLFLLQNSNI